jgi:hypothetical protein
MDSVPTRSQSSLRSEKILKRNWMVKNRGTGFRLRIKVKRGRVSRI